MGGKGSGRRGNHNGNLDDLPRLDIREVEVEGKWFDLHLPGGSIQQIRVTTTPCNYGGSRFWFICPKCRRRVGVLYSDFGHYICRKCVNRPYASQYQDKAQRLEARRLAIFDRLGWTGKFLKTRPKGMRRTTFRRLLDELLGIYEAIGYDFNQSWPDRILWLAIRPERKC